MTLPTARENARLSWGDEPHSVPDDDRVKMLSMQHAVQATERRDKDIAKELRAIIDDQHSNSISMLIEIQKLASELDGEEVSR